MIEPPSKQLLDRLLGLRLCSRADLRRCRRRVRMLARDLPAFDSVWIDALLQIRKITPFQAKLLQSPNPDRVSVGPTVLLDRLGTGENSTTYVARLRDGGERCVLKLIDVPQETLEPALSRLVELTKRLDGFEHPAIAAPRSVVRHDESLVTICRFVRGPHLGEMLVRRGRFPAAEVIRIARQLVGGLTALELRGCAHGDIRLPNVRLTSAGNAVLVDAGINAAIHPELLIRAEMQPERYDGIAPELIGTGNTAGCASDMYALGCLLWQLLAGRPPYPNGDPLAKLALHQTRTLADVREWAPDTPAPLADAICKVTAPSPAERPKSFEELSEAWGRPRRSDRRQLAKFHARMHGTVFRPRVLRESSGARYWTTIALGLFVLTGAALTMLDAGFRNRLAQIASPVADYIAETTEQWTSGPSTDSRQPANETAGTDNSEQTIPLPPPNANGVMTLDSDGPYLWNSRIDAVGSIVIRAAAGRRPTVIVSPGLCRISAERVTFEGIHFRLVAKSANRSSSQTRQHPGFLDIRSQDLIIRRCSFQPNSTATQQTGAEPRKGPGIPAVISWSIHDPGDRSGGRLAIFDTVCDGPFHAIAVSSSPNVIDCRNVLKRGGGSLFRFHASPKPGRECAITLEHTTLRQVGSLLVLSSGPRSDDAGLIAVKAVNCVFDTTGRNGALFQLSGAFGPAYRPLIRMTGVGSIAPPKLTVAAAIGSPATRTSATDTAKHVLLEGGIITSPFRFAGKIDGPPEDSTIVSHTGPRRSAQAPGIDARRLRVPVR